MLTLVPTVSLVLAASLAILNIWLSLRVGQVRRSEKVSVGDAGNERVIRRMRAHANFAENAMIVLALVLVIELAVGTSVWLWAAAALFVVARVLHGLGMDGWGTGRGAGTLVTFLLQLLLALWAIAIPLTADRLAPTTTTEAVPAQG
jgi:uncharacterized membrane protein YecN with MAPEG domain